MAHFKPYILIFLAFLASAGAFAQPGNQWINYDLQHWRFPVAQKGWMQLSYADLQNAGISVNGVNPDALKIFAKERQVFARVEDGGDGSFDPGDFLEFWATPNNGWLDAQIYDDPSHQAHPDYSLFNDTLHYFLTVDPAADAFRTAQFESPTDPNSLTTHPWVWSGVSETYQAEYLFGVQDQYGIALPWYQEGEGWFDNRFSKGQTRNKLIPTPFPFTGPDAPNAQVHAVSTSASLAVGILNHHLQVGYGTGFNVMVDTAFYGYQLNTFNFEIPHTAIQPAGTLISHRSIDDLGVATDYQAVGSIEVNYARTLNMSGVSTLYFEVENLNNSAETKLVFTNVATTNPRLIEQGPGAPREFPVVQNGANWEAIVPFSPDPSSIRLILTDGNDHSSPEGPTPATSTGYFTDFRELDLDSAFVLIAPPQLANAAGIYAFYRQSQGMNVLQANVEELYQQYGGGIWKHPLAIRRFCADLLTYWESPPSHLFLVGKGIHEMKISATEGSRNNPERYAQNLIPPWGNPSSDLAYTAGLGDTQVDAAIPTGRIAAKNEEEVLNYLNKVAEFEAQEPAAWMKKMIHFGGGSSGYEQGLFAGYLANYTALASDTCFGADVHSFFKTTTDPIQLSLSDSIQYLIENGVSLMTFFGHASSTGFDINIDNPSSYNNQGKYPLLIGNSCYTGNIHLSTSNSTSEVFTLAANAGTIGFIAKGDLGIPASLDVWTEQFYRQNFQTHYGESIGQNMQAAVRAFQGNVQNLYTANAALTFALHGDPAIVLNAWPKPDMAITASDVSFSPAQVTADVDSFYVNVRIANLGKAVNTPFGVELVRRLPNGEDTSLVQVVQGIGNAAFVQFALPVDRVEGIGTNTFDVLVDYPANTVDELEDLSNNVVSNKLLQITGGNLIPVVPYTYAITPEGGITLQASTGDPLAPLTNWRMELDTSAAFASPQLLTTNIIQGGGVVQWELPIQLENDQVYFWRCAADNTPEEEYNWRTSSFQFQEGETGWGQSHFDQFAFNTYSGIDYNETEQRIDFTTGTVPLKCTVYGSPANAYEINATRYQLDLEIQDYAGCGNSAALHVAVLDSVNLRPWESNFSGSNPDNDFDNLMDCANGRQRPEKYFIFRQNNATEMAGLVNMLENEVEDGHYLLIYTWKYVNYDGWDENAPELYTTLGSLGATEIGASQDSVPFIFFVKKGYPLSKVELVGAEPDELLELEVELTGTTGAGTIVSKTFGPSNAWDAFLWELNTLEDPSADSSIVSVVGVNGANIDVLNSWNQLSGVAPNLDELVDATAYPYLKFETELFDTQDLTPSQLNFWQVKAAHVPECAVDAHTAFYFPKDTVQAGEPLAVAVAIRNIGLLPMDSLLVSYRVEDAQHNFHQMVYPRSDSLRVGEVLVDTVWIETFDLRGENVLWIEANPYVDGNQTDQLEQVHFNNLLQLRFVVDQDRINPLLDVTFDGMHILHGDIVSAQPQIRVSLDDENPYFILNEAADTSSFKVFVTWPDGEQRPVYFADVALQFLPSDGVQNRAELDYRPQFEQDGRYTLLVQAEDKSGNASGDLDYRIDFEVFMKPTLTDVLNYPNPFSTRTQFVFSLTGVEPPDFFHIQIMTIGGRVIRDIHINELGTLRIGRNQTEFWWDGKDEFGDQLANGIYLYRVSASLHGEPLEMRESGASGFMTKGFGKMYLLR